MSRHKKILEGGESLENLKVKDNKNKIIILMKF